MRGLIFLLLLCSCRTDAWQGPISDHFDGAHFHQENGAEPRGLLDLIRWKMSGDKKKWPESVELSKPLQLPEKVEAGTVAITLINHASVLIQLPGINILTDPVWSERVSPFSWIGPKRVHAPGIPFDKLPPIHWVVVSHNHYDHMDVPTLLRLSREHHPQILVPLGDRHWLEQEGVENVRELDWQEQVAIGPNASITFEPSRHWSARSLWDRNRSLWGSYLIRQEQQQIYFAGDTAYGPHFQNLEKTFGPVQVAILPIGAYEPRWFMETQHMNPADAVHAHQDLKAVHSLGMHYGCWQLTDEAIDDPVKALQAATAALSLAPDIFQAAEAGKTYRFDSR